MCLGIIGCGGTGGMHGNQERGENGKGVKPFFNGCDLGRLEMAGSGIVSP